MKYKTYSIVFKQVGSLMILLGLVEVVPSVVSVIYKEWYSAFGFLMVELVTSCLGYILYKVYQKTEEPHYDQALIIVASAWLILTFVGGLPFYVIAHITPVSVMNSYIPSDANYSFSSLVYFKNPLHCFFESMSAYTTTGLSMADHEPSVGKGVLFYRSFAQWVGGAGFIIMSLAIFKQHSGRSAMLLYGSESVGEKLKPKVIDTSRAIWKSYLFVTVFSVVYLIIGTRIILPNYPISENIFDSINHAMAGQSTGGFSTLDDSIATYKSAHMDMLYLLPMILGSFSLPFYYKIIFKRKFKEIWKDIQTRSLIVAFIVGSIVQSYLLLQADNVPNPIREGIFQFISGMSTTGWQTSNIGAWDWKPTLFLIATGMFIGGASGATVGGIKMIRAIIIAKGLKWQITKSLLSENTVKSIKFNGKSLLPNEMYEEFTKAATIAILFFTIILLSAIATTYFTGSNFDFTDALFESTSAQATVGLSSGITNPSMSPALELIYIFQMWAGRLEILTVFAFIRAIF
jgi:trk system potassium uptake protein TrkH